MRRLLLALCVLVAVGGLGAALAARWAWARAHEPYRGFEEAERFVEIPSGAGVAEIRRRLVAAGVVRDELSLRIALWSSGRARSLQAGEYRFDRAATPLEVVERLAKGDVHLERLTFPEGLMLAEMAEIIRVEGLDRRRSSWMPRTGAPWLPTSTPQRAISRATSFQTPTACRGERRRPGWWS